MQRKEARAYLSSFLPEKPRSIAVAEKNRQNATTIVPGPGAYILPPEEPEKDRKKGKSVQFSSKVPRFPSLREAEMGPGMYDIEGSFEKVVREINSPRNPVVRKAKSPTIKIVKNIDIPEPGPGAYEAIDSLQRSVIKKYINGYKGDFGTH